jgi:hypothetical protein
MYAAEYVVYHPDTHTAIPLTESYIVPSEFFPVDHRRMQPHAIETILFDEQSCVRVCSWAEVEIISAALKAFVEVTTNIIKNERELDDEDTQNIDLLAKCWSSVRRALIVAEDDPEPSWRGWEQQ